MSLRDTARMGATSRGMSIGSSARRASGDTHGARHSSGPPRHLEEETGMRSITVLIAALAAALGASTAAGQAQDPNLARNLAATCANCHGTNGVSQGGTESLAGAGRDDMIRMMKEYKAGTRPGTIMPQLAKGYTDAQIELVAGWFAAQKPAR
jgi:cytochrome c553